MGDTMAICLTDVFNDSCFPKTLGSEKQTSDYSNVGVIQGFVTLIAAVFVIWYLKNALVTWYKKYRLQYLLRISLFLYFTVIALNVLQYYGIVVHGEYDYYFEKLRNSLGRLSLVMMVVRYFWKKPLNITKRFDEVGSVHLKKYVADAMHRMRRLFEIIDAENIPPVFPNGWFAIIDADKIATGQLMGVNVLGYRFAVFRGEESGEAFVIDAYCPHLGADLTVGGEVHGNCIKCPFHGWYADGTTGACTRDFRVTNGGIVHGRVKKWKSCEMHGSICVYHNVEEDRQEPEWEIPRVDPVCNGEWVYRGRTEHEVCCHIQEIPENGADINHLKVLHSTSVFLGCNWMDTKSWFNVVSHHWEPHWRRDEENPHIARISLKQITTFMGFPIPLSRLDISIEQIGPAIVHLHINSWFGRAILVQTITPEGPLFMRVIHKLYTEPGFGQFPAELLLRAEAIMFERNIARMKLKDYFKKSLQVTENCPIRQYQRWYNSQFFSTNSPTLLSLRDKILDF